ncbi:MAG: hypothetical protein HY329_16340, partial [Chloroflexi bacterium]|nr:hypothetical protein [Chloroflexota bacterium]
MKRPRLNLSTLRSHHFPRARPTILTPGQLLESPDSVTLSRRTLLKLGGIAAVGASPALDALQATSLGPIDIVAGQDRVAFMLDGRERWVVDTRHFGGSPRLSLQRTDTLVRLDLVGAKLPGTELSADLTAELRPDFLGWRLSLRLAFGGFQGEAPFERWLLGEEPVRAIVSSDGPVCKLGGSSGLVLSGRAQAELFPMWSLRLSGRSIAKLFGQGPDLVADAIEIALLDALAPSLMTPTEAKRSIVALRRGDRVWAMSHVASNLNGWRLATTGRSFDTLTIETAETKSGGARRALVAEAGSAEAPLLLESSAGTGLSLPLRRVRHAIAFDPTGDQVVLLAEIGSAPVWVHGDGCSLQLADPPGRPALEVLARNGVIEKVECAPALLRVVLPLPRLVVEPGHLPAGTRIKLIPDTAATTPRGKTTQASIEPHAVAPIIVVPLSFPVSIVRPPDLLALRFHFINLVFKTGPARLERADPEKPAYIVVYFPPQHIAEEAFYEQDKPFELDGSPAEDALKQPGQVRARAAGESRLAFRVPDETGSIAYSLESLLAWTSFRPSVTATALPPPPRPGRPHPPDDDTTLPVPGAIDLTPPLLEPEAHQTAIEAP